MSSDLQLHFPLPLFSTRACNLRPRLPIVLGLLDAVKSTESLADIASSSTQDRLSLHLLCRGSRQTSLLLVTFPPFVSCACSTCMAMSGHMEPTRLPACYANYRPIGTLSTTLLTDSSLHLPRSIPATHIWPMTFPIPALIPEACASLPTLSTTAT